jgi:hypothetical protein
MLQSGGQRTGMHTSTRDKREDERGADSQMGCLVYQDTGGTRTEEETTAIREWQVVGSRKKTGRMEIMEKEGATIRPKVRATPSKVVGATGKLSVPQPGTNPPQQREDEMEADEIIRFSEGTIEKRYLEPY